jgi:hypothetical protein
MDGVERGLCEGQGENDGYRPVSLLSRENRVAYIKRKFTVYNKKVSHGWCRERTV